MSGIPEWAADRASRLFCAEREERPDAGSTTVWQDAFARYIAEHEEPPVDPLKECLAETYGAAAPEFVSAFKHALAKRGLEIREMFK